MKNHNRSTENKESSGRQWQKCTHRYVLVFWTLRSRIYDSILSSAVVLVLDSDWLVVFTLESISDRLVTFVWPASDSTSISSTVVRFGLNFYGFQLFVFQG